MLNSPLQFLPTLKYWVSLEGFYDKFDMILFDPPHFIRDKKENNDIALLNRYGFLYYDEWKQTLQKGIDELFRVLKPNGVFVFKWAIKEDHGIKKKLPSIDDILILFPYKPIFGSRNIRSKVIKSNLVYWFVFLKYDVNKKLEEINENR